MIIDKETPPKSPGDHVDPPPSYDEISPGPSRHHAARQNEKVSCGPSHLAGAPSTQDKKSKGKARASWFGLSKKSKEVRATVYGIIRDVVKQPTTSASLSLLQNCAESCNAHNLDFSSILQDPSIEEHPPIYWAIIKRPSPEEYELLNAILSYSAPLKPQTVSQIRLACLLVGDQALFYSLWKSPEFAMLSGRDEMLLGDSIPPDSIQVRELPGDKGTFVAQFEILQFEKRMKVSGLISLEFIARGRMWWLRFHVLSERQGISQERRLGAWAVSLAILEHSPATWIDSQVIIHQPGKQNQRRPLQKPPSNNKSLSSRIGSLSDSKPRPELSLHLKTGHYESEQLRPLSANRRKRSDHDVLTALLDDVPMGSSLQYSDSSYYTPDGTLHVSLEGRLGRPENEDQCIIC